DSSTGVTVGADAAWVEDTNVSGNAIYSATGYYIVWKSDALLTIYSDGGAANGYIYKASEPYADAFPSPISWSTVSFIKTLWSLYCTFTPGNGEEEEEEMQVDIISKR
ncbi:hypothetical protein KAR91_03705, partial [Candidatus Pacearchaeota archaeon]|nr:hypothetical protein [Candidatus Pacearchaeota archaeon]